MSKFVLLDANLLIGAFDHDASNPQHLDARAQVEALLRDDTLKIAITPLIRYEVLRGVKQVSTEVMQSILNDFEEFEITDIEANRAAKIYHLARQGGEKLDKHSFDVFHYVVAEIRDLELLSQNVKDFAKIERIANQMGSGGTS